MKKFLLLLSLFFALTLSAQEMPSVAGVTFGWTRAECKRVLDNRFNGGESSYQSAPNEMTYRNVRFWGYYYNYAWFLFQSDGNRTYLRSVNFCSDFDATETQKATQMRDELYETYSKKYDFFFSDINEDGYKSYHFGFGPEWKDGQGIVIDTWKVKTLGVIRTEVYYYYNIINEEDEI